MVLPLLLTLTFLSFRCLEIDTWDGPDGEPMVCHGYTLTSKVPLAHVLQTIKGSAFIANEYPIILSIENHCNPPQQEKMAALFRIILGESLFMPPEAGAQTNNPTH